MPGTQRSIEYFYFLKPPGNENFIFVAEETYYAAARYVGDTRSEVFAFIGQDEEGNEWRGKAEVKKFVKDRV